MKWWKRWRWKSRFLNACHAGGIYREQEMSDGKKHRHLPKVKRIEINEEKQAVKYNIELRIGINPKLITDNKWLFEQRIGEVLFLDIKSQKYLTLIIKM